MHELQQQIIHRLILGKECRYRDIKPKEVEGNLFMYHLRQLLKEDLVKKEGTHYQLTSHGMRLADSLSLKSLQPRIQPKIVTLLACRNKKGEWLLYQRKRQPFYGLVGFPYGKIHLGETIGQAAERELQEKTGLMAQLRHAGDVYVTAQENDQLISQMFCHIFVGQNPSGVIKKETAVSECQWRKVNTIDQQFMPGFKEIFTLLQKKSPNRFFSEIFINQKPAINP